MNRDDERDARLVATLRRGYDAYSHADFDEAAIELDFDAWTVWTFDADGLATRAEIFLDHQEAEALKAARLRA